MSCVHTRRWTASRLVRASISCRMSFAILGTSALPTIVLSPIAMPLGIFSTFTSLFILLFSKSLIHE